MRKIMEQHPKKLLDRVRETIRLKHYSSLLLKPRFNREGMGLQSLAIRKIHTALGNVPHNGLVNRDAPKMLG